MREQETKTRARLRALPSTNPGKTSLHFSGFSGEQSELQARAHCGGLGQPNHGSSNAGPAVARRGRRDCSQVGGMSIRSRPAPFNFKQSALIIERCHNGEISPGLSHCIGWLGGEVLRRVHWPGTVRALCPLPHQTPEQIPVRHGHFLPQAVNVDRSRGRDMQDLQGHRG